MNGRGGDGMRPAENVGLSVIGGPVMLQGKIYEGHACAVNVPDLGGVIVILAMNPTAAAGACEYLSGTSMSLEGVKHALLGSPKWAQRTL
jgi:hypothetical protein